MITENGSLSSTNHTPRGMARLALVLIAALGSAAAGAADLPFFSNGSRTGSPFPSGSARPAFGGLLPDPVYVGPRRFDVYGHPIQGTVFAEAPGPLYASTGCPVALQPVYDSVGNFAGYSAIQMCR